MEKILGLCVILVLLAVTSEAKPNYEYYSYDYRPVECNYECQQQQYQFTGALENALNKVLGTVTMALKSFDRYVDELSQHRGPQTVVVGPGHHNNNKVMINSG